MSSLVDEFIDRFGASNEGVSAVANPFRLSHDLQREPHGRG